MTSWKANQPYNNLSIFPPSQDVESKIFFKACIGARVALAELK